MSCSYTTPTVVNYLLDIIKFFHLRNSQNILVFSLATLIQTIYVLQRQTAYRRVKN